jgi:hypothetical protein
LLGEQDLVVIGHANLDANSLVMVTLRQATSCGGMVRTSAVPGPYELDPYRCGRVRQAQDD